MAGHLVSACWHLVAQGGHLVSVVRHLVSAGGHLVSTVRHFVSAGGHLVSEAGHVVGIWLEAVTQGGGPFASGDGSARTGMARQSRVAIKIVVTRQEHVFMTCLPCFGEPEWNGERSGTRCFPTLGIIYHSCPGESRNPASFCGGSRPRDKGQAKLYDASRAARILWCRSAFFAGACGACWGPAHCWLAVGRQESFASRTLQPACGVISSGPAGPAGAGPRPSWKSARATSARTAAPRSSTTAAREAVPLAATASARPHKRSCTR